MRFFVKGITRQGTNLSLGLVLLTTASLTACSQHDGVSRSTVEQKLEAMMGKMGVPGASSTPSKAAMALDCPPIKTMLDEVRQAPASISPASRQALNAWARWCNQEALPEQAS